MVCIGYQLWLFFFNMSNTSQRRREFILVICYLKGSLLPNE